MILRQATRVMNVLALAAWAFLVAHSARAESAPPHVQVVIDAGKTYAPISPNLYGMFVEHLRNVVNTGMWSEMLDDRKFYNPIITPAALAARLRPRVGAAGRSPGDRGAASSSGTGTLSARRMRSPWTRSTLTSQITASMSRSVPPNRVASANPVYSCKVRGIPAESFSRVIREPRRPSA